jgi:hypothetical protein
VMIKASAMVTRSKTNVSHCWIINRRLNSFCEASRSWKLRSRSSCSQPNALMVARPLNDSMNCVLEDQ